MEPRPDSTAISQRVLLAALAGVGALLVLGATRDGPGTTPDGVSYLGAARNLADGRGLSGAFVTAVDPFGPAQAHQFDGAVPFIQWPPAYPAVLWIGSWTGAEADEVARWVSALSLGLLVASVAWIAGRLTGGSTVAMLAAGVVVLAQPQLGLLHVLVASEPLYLLLSTLALWCAARAVTGAPQDRRWLAAAAVAASMATLTRYVGAAVVVVVALSAAVGPNGAARRRVRWRDGALTLVIGLGPAVWWALSQSNQADVPTRTLAWHPPSTAQWRYAVETATGWVSPIAAPTVWRVVAVVVGGVFVALAVRGWRAHWGDAPDLTRRWVQVSTLAALVSILAVIATHTLFDRGVPLGERLLVPSLIWCTPTLVSGVWLVARRWAPVGRVAIAAAAVVLAAPMLGQWVQRFTDEPASVDPATVAAVAELPSGVVVASNDPSLAYETTRRFVLLAPVRRFVTADRENPDFELHLDELDQLAAEYGGVVVLYRRASFFAPHVVTASELADRGWETLAETTDAVVLASGLDPGYDTP